MFLLDGRVITSASDLTAASHCEFAFLRKLDAKLGRIEPVPDPYDAMLERTARLGDRHEERMLERYREKFGSGVVEVARPETMSTETLEAAAAETRAAFESSADIVFQATFFDGSFVGFADFIVRQPDGSWLVQDTKLARHARVTALLQLAAYVLQLEALGLRSAPTVELLLGDGTTSQHAVDDIMPVYLKRRARLLQLVDERLAAAEPVAWGDPRYTIDGRCPTCEAEVVAHRDVLLVAGMRLHQRERLLNAGVTTIDELAASGGDIAGIATSTLDGLRAQAALQVRAGLTEQVAETSETPEPLEPPVRPQTPGTPGSASTPGAPEPPDAATGALAPPPFLVHDASALAVIPAPDPGDIFFDFEGDPLYTEDGVRWGLDYLFGLVEADGTFRAWWAHTLAEERAALEDFLAYLAERRAQYPGMHVYHYAAYERTHLLSIAARHGVGEHAVDQLLREHVLVDLYPIVRRAVRVGSRSYSIKMLEPLYMPEGRTGEVTTAGDSINEYVEARALTASGDIEGGQRMLDSIAEYNRYDCESTLALRDWLLALGVENGVAHGTPAEKDVNDFEESPLALALLERAGDPLGERSADESAAALAAAAIDYHRREQKSFWWAHFARLVDPIEEWEDARDVLRVTDARVVRDWHQEGRQRTERRHVLLRGTWAPGSTVKPSGQAGPFVVYDLPGPFTHETDAPGARASRQVAVAEVFEDGALIIETVPGGVEPWTAVPIAVTPSPPPHPGQQKPAIEWWAQKIVDAAGAGDGWPKDAVVDILRRTPPRTHGGALAPVIGEDYAAAVVTSLLDLDDSYLAVQGPPGTGKTWLASHVIAELVRTHRWKIGVVAQSHAVVENLLKTLIDEAGLDPQLVGKAPKAGTDLSLSPFTVLGRSDDLSVFTHEHASTGYVIGGTAWDFSHPRRVNKRSLDLLVVDEAGQFSLASTIAASVAARNLLLLGDPQQLPQVSQGTHPEPVDTSALGWVADGHDVLPAEYGYFLAASRRMHPSVAGPVSRLSYEGELHSHPTAEHRELRGVEPGVHAVPVEHTGNSTESAEEAARVVELVRGLLGRSWRESADAEPRPLQQADVIVVTPYNAQLALVAGALAEAGFGEVPVGTVDKFQGQQAAVAIVSLAASSAADVPRGMEFLIMKNRLNVAISRAQWAAYVLYSPALTEYLPTTPDGVARLSAFIRLVEPPTSVP